MARPTSDKTIRIHLHLYEDDWKFIKTYFNGPDLPSPSAAVRTIVRAYLANLRTKVERSAQPVALPENLDLTPEGK